MKRSTNLLRTDLQIAVIVPCYNEERSISKVVTDFRKELPEAVVYDF